MPSPFEIIPVKTNASLFIFGDHASRFIPPELENLGLGADDLSRHIAWDIGTEVIIRRLCAHFSCAGQLAGVSRLVIDLNRDPAHAGLIPESSDGTLIPANKNLSGPAREQRMSQYYAPYHNALSAQLDALPAPFVLSVHSFTPQPKTSKAARPTQIGLLMRHDEPSARGFAAQLQAHPSRFNVGINKPYSAYDLNHTVDFHLAPRGLPHLAIEIRQDLIDNDSKASGMADILAECLTPLL